MKARGVRSAIGAVLLLGLGCAAARPLSPLPPGAGKIAVLPVRNALEESLLVEGGSALESLVFSSDRVTVGDVLAASLRQELRRHGYEVVEPAAVDGVLAGRAATSTTEAAALARDVPLDASLLFLEIRRWDAEADSHPRFVIASVRATLFGLSTREQVWQADIPSRPVQTPGSATAGDAYRDACQRLARELLASTVPVPEMHPAP